MEITFLGTGTSQGVPVIACPCAVCCSSDPRDQRLRTSIMISEGGRNLVIDTGPDFRQQMLREKVGRLDAVVFTHEHKDHTAGLDDVRAFNYFQGTEIDVYATARVEASLRNEFPYIFAEIRYPGVPQLRIHPIGNMAFEAAGIRLLPVEVLHYRLPVLGFRTGSFTYITDANEIPEMEFEKIRGSEVLVLNALRKEKHISHFTLEEALSIIEKVKPGRAYLTHISHQLGLHGEVQSTLPEHVFLAYDGLRITL